MSKIAKTLFLLIVVFGFGISITFSLFGSEDVKLHQTQTSSFRILAPQKAKICLNMIVKNESRIIERCLNSVKDVVDCISICDTGSTDNTVEVIEQFMKANKIPGKVHQHVWKNFGHNRTLSFEAAQKTLQELNFPLADTYLLLLDADMILEVAPTFRRHPLITDAYYVLQKNNFQSYYNIRLIRASLPWECVGVTHEYWSCKQHATEMQMQHLNIDDREDGGCKADKFERDIKLLTEGLKEDPHNARYIFYLAQSHKCLEQFNEAIKWYKARIAIGGWLEEVWYSQLMLGEIYEKLKFWDSALHWYLTAYQTNPERAEPLQKIATYYRVKGENHLAYLFAKQGSRIPFPKDQLLFISHPAYDYQFDEEISIAAYYIPSYKEEGFEAADRLMLKKTVPQHIKNQSQKNLFFYVQNLPDASFQKTAGNFHFSKDNIAEYDLTLPVVVQKITKDNNSETAISASSNYDFSHFRGFPAPVEFDEGYLMLIHEIVEMDQKRHALHRFAYLDKKGQIQKLSRPFIFKNKGPESCDLMTVDHTNQNCQMSIQTENQDTWLCSIHFDKIRSLLKPLP